MPAREANQSASLDQVFDELKTILARHARLFTEREGMVKNKRDYHLILQKPLVIGGRKRDELWFASIIQQKDSVGVYFTPPDVKSFDSGSSAEADEPPPLRMTKPEMGIAQN
jgi:hypothetical protein